MTPIKGLAEFWILVETSGGGGRDSESGEASQNVSYS